MELRYSHIDILVTDLDRSVEYFERLGFTSGSLQVWERDDFHVQYKVLFNEWQRFMLVQPFSGNLKDLLDEKGEGHIYRFCLSTDDLPAAHRELTALGVPPVNESGHAISVDELDTPAGPSILWLPPAVGSLSIEILEEPVDYPI